MIAIIRYHYPKLQPDEMEYQELVRIFNEYVFVKKQERIFHLNIFRQVMSEAFQHQEGEEIEEWTQF
jgi:hypothetical protein